MRGSPAQLRVTRWSTSAWTAARSSHCSLRAIVALQPALRAERPSHEACGRLVSPGLVESHFHLDKALTVAPTGEIVARSVSDEDEVVGFNADIDLANDLNKTMFNFAAHRRPKHYKLIVKRVGAEVTPAEGP